MNVAEIAEKFADGQAIFKRESVGTLLSEIDSLQEEIKRYRDALEFNQLVEKLSLKKKPFIVVAIDEPYFKEVYNAIRNEEKRKNSWNQEDEIAYIKALKINQTLLNGGK